MPTLAQALATALSHHTNQAFGLMGNGNAHFIDALADHGVRVSEVRHEAATVASADAFTRISGRLAIATTTYGAGFTNTLTALAEATQARTPMLLVVGDAPSTGSRPWDIDQQLSAVALGVRTYTVLPERVESAVEKAVAESLRHRRPVVLSIPYDLVSSPVPSCGSADQQGTTREPRDSPAVLESEITRAAEMLGSAQRPIVLAGRGAWVSGAGLELDTIASQLGALTATTALARGIFSESQFDLGVTGGFGQDAAMRLISDADVVLVVGAALNQFTMRFGALFGAGAKVVRIDLDQVEPPKTNSEIDHLLLRGDAREVLAALSKALHAAHPEVRGWRESVTGLEGGGVLRELDRGSQRPDGMCDDGRLDPRALASRLAELLPEDRHVTSDGGHFLGWANMFWPVASPERMIMVGTAYQTIGLGFATVAGVAAAAPESTVVLSTGDGGGLMSLADLETAVRTAPSCVIVVWNDGQYGAEVHLYGAMGLDEAPMKIPDVNFAGLASALGATGVRVERLSDLDALVSWREAGARGTILLDCRISGAVVAPYQREIQRVNGLEID